MSIEQNSNTNTVTLVISTIVALALGYLIGSQTQPVSDISINLDRPTKSLTSLAPVPRETAISYVKKFQDSCENETKAAIFDFPTIFNHILQGNPSPDWSTAGFYAYFAQYPDGKNTVVLQFVQGLGSAPTVIPGVEPLNMGDLCPAKCLTTGGLDEN